MAVFLLNVCKFSGCGLHFPTLGDLIQHIEDTHIDSDPRALEKQELQPPPSLPISYIFKFFCETGKKDNNNLDLQKKKQRAQSPVVSIRSSTPTGSEFDEDDLQSEDEDSDDSWTTQEEFSSELILSMMGTKDGDGEKPFACPVPGCKKRYKNVNGIKYHARHGHRKDTRVKKAFKCKCGKSYKTTQGLRNHALMNHGTAAAGLIAKPSAQTIASTIANQAAVAAAAAAALPQGQGQVAIGIQQTGITLSQLPLSITASHNIPVSLSQSLMATASQIQVPVTITEDGQARLQAQGKPLMPLNMSTVTTAPPNVTVTNTLPIGAIPQLMTRIPVTQTMAEPAVLVEMNGEG